MKTTNKVTHTPGPWFVNGPWHIQSNIKTEKPTIIATVIRIDDYKQRESNANLIAASPELLEACKFILSQLDPNGDHPKTQCVLNSDCLSPKETDDQSVVEYLKEVISKAEGK